MQRGAAQRLGCSCRTMLHLNACGILLGCTLPVGKKKWIRRDTVEDLLTSMRVRSRADGGSEKARRELFLLWQKL